MEEDPDEPDFGRFEPGASPFRSRVWPASNRRLPPGTDGPLLLLAKRSHFLFELHRPLPVSFSTADSLG